MPHRYQGFGTSAVCTDRSTLMTSHPHMLKSLHIMFLAELSTHWCGRMWQIALHARPGMPVLRKLCGEWHIRWVQ